MFILETSLKVIKSLMFIQVNEFFNTNIFLKGQYKL